MADTPDLVTEVVELLRARSGHGMIAWKRDPRDPSRLNAQVAGCPISINADNIEFSNGYTFESESVRVLYATALKWAQDVKCDDTLQQNLGVIRDSLK